MTAHDNSTGFVIAPGSATAVHLTAGQIVDIIDLDGKQVSDVIAFSTRQPDSEWLSPTHTRTALGQTKLQLQDTLLTNLRRPAMRLVYDDVGVHDMSVAMCDDQRYVQDFGVAGHANCRDGMVSASASILPDTIIPDPFNIFQNTTVEVDGSLITKEPASGAGDRVSLEALIDLIFVASACPQDLNACNGWHPSRIEMIVHEK